MRLELQINGKLVICEAEKIGGQLWVHYRGETFVRSLQATGKSRRRQVGAGAGGDIVAPMPGKVTKLSVQLGDTVKAGQVLVVMEAMKMEYTLKSAGPGTVRAIECKVGEQVIMGHRLVHVEES